MWETGSCSHSVAMIELNLNVYIFMFNIYNQSCLNGYLTLDAFKDCLWHMLLHHVPDVRQGRGLLLCSPTLTHLVLTCTEVPPLSSSKQFLGFQAHNGDKIQGHTVPHIFFFRYHILVFLLVDLRIAYYLLFILFFFFCIISHVIWVFFYYFF